MDFCLRTIRCELRVVKAWLPCEFGRCCQCIFLLCVILHLFVPSLNTHWQAFADEDNNFAIDSGFHRSNSLHTIARLAQQEESPAAFAAASAYDGRHKRRGRGKTNPRIHLTLGIFGFELSWQMIPSLALIAMG